MKQSKNLAIAFLLGAVVVGGALGFSADRYMLRDRIGAHPSLRERLDASLKLDSAQRTRLDSILDHRRHQRELVMANIQPALDSIMATVQPAFDSIKLRAREEIRAMLTPTQRIEFEKLLADTNATNKTRDDDN
jgi:hypothetical protein